MEFTTIAMIALMVVAFYFLILRPQKKRQQAQQKTMNELTPGTRVLLGSGVFGTLTWVGVKQATMETAPGVELTVLKQAIARVVTDGDEYTEPVVEEDDELDEIDDLDERDDVDGSADVPAESAMASEPTAEPSTIDLPETERSGAEPRTANETSTRKD